MQSTKCQRCHLEDDPFWNAKPVKAECVEWDVKPCSIQSNLTVFCHSRILCHFLAKSFLYFWEVGSVAVHFQIICLSEFVSVCMLQKAVPLRDLLPCLLLISQQVFPVLHKWRYHEPRARDRIGLWTLSCCVEH